MKVFVSKEGSGFLGSTEEFDKLVINEIIQMTPPKTSRPNTEYVVKISNGVACVFRVNIGMRPKFIVGSILVQIERGSLKVGFVDIHDENLLQSICKLIQDFWSAVSKEANSECSMVFAPAVVEEIL